MTKAAIDARFMQLALRMAERGLGTTAPNPSVGAVLVRFDGDPAGIVVGRGWTQPSGRPHAETQALAAAGAAARGATLYVTLEPCSHHGRTPPCADAVIAAGVRRVVAGLADPDPRVSGRGLTMLRAAGVEVTTGIEAAACQRLTLGHILRVTQNRPMVTLKLALRADLTVPAGVSGRPTFVTGPEARAAGHLLRARSDAILVGSGTVRADDPELTCRLPGLSARSPARIILDGRLDTVTPASKLALTAHDVPVWVMTSAQAPDAARAALEAKGVRVSLVEARGTHLQLPALLALLAENGVTRLMVEGGRRVWQAFASLGLVDDAVIFVQGRGGGPQMPNAGSALAATTFEGLTGLTGPAPLALAAQGTIGADRYVHFQSDLMAPR